MTSLRHYELSDFEWSIMEPLLPNKPRGVPRADDRKVLNGIYWRLRTGAPWAEIPERYGPATTCYNRFVRGRKLGVWDRIFEAVSAAYDGDLQMGTVPRCGCAGTRPTSKVPAVELCGPAGMDCGSETVSARVAQTRRNTINREVDALAKAFVDIALAVAAQKLDLELV